MSSVSGVAGILIMFVLFSGYKLEILDPTFEADFEKFVERTMECRFVPGLTLAIVKGNETWTRGFGIAELSGHRKVDNSTLFGIGSVSKSFTMVLLGILLAENEMDWSTKVSEILGPDYQFVDEYRSKETTLRDLLSHRTGLAALDIGWMAGFPEDKVTRETLCKKIKRLPEYFPFRDQFYYNNFLYMTLGHIAEKLGGESWESLMTSRVFEPLGMTSARIVKVPSDVLEPNVAHPLIYKDGMYQNGTLDIYRIHPIEPAGAIFTNGEDMAKYMRFNLNKGMTDDGRQLIDKELLQQAWIPTTTTSTFVSEPDFPVTDATLGYGHAWFERVYRGYSKIDHSGGFFSYTTNLWWFPDKNIGLFVSTNGPVVPGIVGYAVETIPYYISDYLLGKTAWINDTTTCLYPDFWRKTPANSIPIEPSVRLSSPSDYVGVYGNLFLPAINVSVNTANNKTLKFQMNKVGGLLHSTNDKDRFLMEVTSPWEYIVEFTDNNNVSTIVNATFKRSGDIVNSIEFQFEVKVLYQKGVDMTNVPDAHTSGAVVLTIYNMILFSALYLSIFRIIFI